MDYEVYMFVRKVSFILRQNMHRFLAQYFTLPKLASTKFARRCFAHWSGCSWKIWSMTTAEALFRCQTPYKIHHCGDVSSITLDAGVSFLIKASVFLLIYQIPVVLRVTTTFEAYITLPFHSHVIYLSFPNTASCKTTPLLRVMSPLIC